MSELVLIGVDLSLTASGTVAWLDRSSTDVGGTLTGAELSLAASGAAAWPEESSTGVGSTLTASTQGAKALVRFLCAKPESDHAVVST